ncbi:5,10-methenyltetrahydrofolate synthetase [Candidatus Kinetoplastibacterium oncopeltii TCC290E]|uniref:5-formyltetrahydrofolate cyclo-ligase n=1 Tax=Candidatus Kinetoplastidibacterium stringomonadis TCC290E TaxID=1208920 RepID=M1LZY0_9PROT|nr:5-formyltetrahydrofolate cyclo-ligase [Candidatus Kinetoplastibacterium oncopeltii]AGF48649.1 5,10-methenyltetrahydrofolate synthetase [Candidatus Kinetoplastibacterium oncopeltii TCC290E]
MTNKKIRSILKIKRLEMSAEERDIDSDSIQKQLFHWIKNITANSLKTENSLQIATFWPMKLEPNIIWLNNKLSELENVNLSLPVTKDSDRYLEFREWDPSVQLIKGKYGILEPYSKSVITKPNIIFVPTLGYSNVGDRIGYGSGYYDRTLAELINQNYKFITIGIAWDQGLITESYKAAQHDIRLNAIVTPSGWINKSYKEYIP